MQPIKVIAHIDDQGHIEVDASAALPLGDVLITIEPIDSTALSKDSVQWADAFARSQDILAAMANEALRELDAGLTDELDPDTRLFNFQHH